jgi:RNA polymerase sigma-70 factor (ECF subfamily)
MDDDTLMIRTAQGEEAAFRFLVQRWEKDVLAFLIHMLGSVKEAEDLVQDTFVQVFRKADGYQAQGLFKSWLFRIAGNQARSRLRRRKILRWVRFDTTEHEIPAADAGPLADLERAEATRAVQAAVAELPPRQREALLLHRFQGMKYKEVATVMDTTVPGVESLIQRAMAALKNDLTLKDLAGKVDP